MEDVLRIDRILDFCDVPQLLWQEMPLIHCIFAFCTMMRRFIAIREFVSLHIGLNLFSG